MHNRHPLHTYVSISLIIHALMCAFLFLAIIHKQLPSLQKAALSKSENIPAPVIFVKPKEEPKEEKVVPKSDPFEVDPPGMPKGLAINMSQLPDESLLVNKKPGLKDQKNVEETGKAVPLPAIPPKDMIDLKKETNDLPKKDPLLTKKSDTGLPVPKEMTLADLFKNAHKALGHEEKILSSEDGGGPSGDIVITEGSLKYYSLWVKFLQHLNDAARFNRRGGIDRDVQMWLQTGLIRKEALFAIDIDKKGQIVNVTLLSSSGHTPFDKLCITDIWSAAPYPPLPSSIDRPTARFQVKAFF